MADQSLTRKKPGARPRFTAQQVADSMIKCHGLMTLAAADLGTSRQTIDSYAKRFATVREAAEEGLNRILDITEGKLHHAIMNGEAWAICFFLKTRGKQRGYIERQELDVNWREEAKRDGIDPDVFFERAVAEAMREMESSGNASRAEGSASSHPLAIIRPFDPLQN